MSDAASKLADGGVFRARATSPRPCLARLSRPATCCGSRRGRGCAPRRALRGRHWIAQLGALPIQCGRHVVERPRQLLNSDFGDSVSAARADRSPAVQRCAAASNAAVGRRTKRWPTHSVRHSETSAPIVINTAARHVARSSSASTPGRYMPMLTNMPTGRSVAGTNPISRSFPL